MIDAAARAEQLTGHQTLGIAVSWSTAERLGRDSPALAATDVQRRRARRRASSTASSMSMRTRRSTSTRPGWPTPTRLDRLTEIVERTGAKLVAIGDAAQLPSIGAGGMFDRLAEIAPSARALERPPDAWTPRNSARGRTSAPDAPTGRWRTTTHADNSTWPTPATRPSSTPCRTGRSSPRPTRSARSR